MSRDDFQAYVYSFYGRDGAYPMGATLKQIKHATTILLQRFDNVDYDSVDRERVRDIMKEEFGLTEPTAHSDLIVYT